MDAQADVHLVVRIWHKTGFLMTWLICCLFVCMSFNLNPSVHPSSDTVFIFGIKILQTIYTINESCLLLTFTRKHVSLSCFHLGSWVNSALSLLSLVLFGKLWCHACTLCIMCNIFTIKLHVICNIFPSLLHFSQFATFFLEIKGVTSTLIPSFKLG